MAEPEQLQAWQQKAKEKRQQTLDSIPHKWRLTPDALADAAKQRSITGSYIKKFLDPETIAVTDRDTCDLVFALQKGELSAVQVASAFCEVAAVAHQINNCLHEYFPEIALERAKMLDDYFAKNGKPVGPLHGLPVSLKDQFHVKGVDTTMGYVGWIGGNMGVSEDKTHQVESNIVKELASLGAVFYCKTSLPQTLMCGETVNNIIGMTMNPHNTNLSCGGSSGGEGALLALRGSPIGVGTDIGGSVRIPAAFCGVFSIKPTPDRVPYRDAANTIPGETAYKSTIGFLSHSLPALSLLFQALVSQSPPPWTRDPSLVPLPWREAHITAIHDRVDPLGRPRSNARPLRIGVFRRNGHVEPHPPIIRGVNLVETAVQEAGHEIVEWSPPSHNLANEIHMGFIFADGGHDVNSHTSRSGEPIIPPLREAFRLREAMSLVEYQKLTVRALAFENEYNDYWESTGGEDGHLVDAVIMPVAAHAAVRPGQYYESGYTESINLLNYSSAVIPVTKADKDLDPVDAAYKPLNDMDLANWKGYDPEIYHGGPVGVQIVCRKFEEEKALAIAAVIHSILENKSKSGSL